MAKKKTETGGLMPNGNIVKYDTTKTAKLPEKPKRKPRKPLPELTNVPEEMKLPGYQEPEPDLLTRKVKGEIPFENPALNPAAVMVINSDPAPMHSEPAKPQKEFTEKQIQKAGEMFKGLLKQGKTLRQARRITERKTGVPILPDNSQPYTNPENTVAEINKLMGNPANDGKTK